MDFLEFPQRHREKSVPQGLKANKLGRLMSGLKPGPTPQQTFSAACKASEQRFPLQTVLAPPSSRLVVAHSCCVMTAREVVLKK
jgi:hypothetical protein